jgi:hypothetical protein
MNGIKKWFEVTLNFWVKQFFWIKKKTKVFSNHEINCIEWIAESAQIPKKSYGCYVCDFNIN